MKRFLNRQFSLRSIAVASCACISLSFTACEKDGSNTEAEKRGSFFLSVTGESAEYILRAEQIESGAASIAENSKTLELSGYTWIFNDEPSVAIGLIYRQGDPGVGLAYTVNGNDGLVESGQFQIASRFTSYGFFDRYAITSVGGQTPVDASGNALLDAAGNARTDGVTFNFIDLKNGFALNERTITTRNITGNGEQATFSGIVDIGGGEFLTGLVVSQPRDPNASGGASAGTVTYPDSVWVAAFDANLNLKRIYRDNRIGYSAGRFRSQYYSQIGKAGNGDVYVFSGSYETAGSRPCGALKIARGANSFDASYYFNIEEKTGGFRFRKIWHIVDNSFLLELYNELEITSTVAATQYGVVDMSAKTFRWLDGVPAKDNITATGLPAPYGGKMYFPITAANADPAVYIIDPVSATATKGLSVTGATCINAIGILTR